MEKVISSWRNYLEHLNFTAPQGQAQLDAFIHERDKRLMTLIGAIAEDLEIEFDRMDIKQYSYAPQAWEDDEFDHRMVRKHLIDVLRGLRALHITAAPPLAGSGPFPPSPMPPSPPPAAIAPPTP